MPSGLNHSEIELTVLMPCLNEAETLATCIDKAFASIRDMGINAEVLIADNGSDDGSQAIAVSHGARVVDVERRGYGAALSAGIKSARGKFVIMGDSDDSYDFSALGAFVEKLREGYDLVMGNRFKGGIAKGAMPPLHRYLGNPVLSGMGKLFFPSEINDFHCGLRGFNKSSIESLNLMTTGMEFASEMVVKAHLKKLKVTEIPTTLSPDGRSRKPHLRSWSDGWRHLRFLLMYSPHWLFLYPGVFIFLFGLLCIGLVLPGQLSIGSVVFDIHTLVIGTAATVVGSELIIFFLLCKQYTYNRGLLPSGTQYETYRKLVNLERTVVVGVIGVLLGSGGVIYALVLWASSDFGELDYSTMMRIIVPSITALAIGTQVILAGFLSSILDLEVKQGDAGSSLP